MIVLDPRGCVVARYYLDVFPQISDPQPFGAARSQPGVRPADACAAATNIQPGAAQQAGIAGGAGSCLDRLAPRSVVRGRARFRRGRLVLRGTAADRGCRARLARVTVTVGKRVARGRCRFVDARGRLGRARNCLRGLPLLARGTSRWSLRLRARLPRGRYVLLARAVDTAGNVEPARRRGPNVGRLSLG
jgi:hypothetical protein